MTTVHATCVAVFGDMRSGCLILGASGAGKSDLALRLIDQGAVLVADDRVILSSEREQLWGSPPNTLAGLLEIRGIGPVEMPHLAQVHVRLAVSLVPVARIERLAAGGACWSAHGAHLPRLDVDASQASAAARVRWAMRRILDFGGLGVIESLPPAEDRTGDEAPPATRVEGDGDKNGTGR